MILVSDSATPSPIVNQSVHLDVEGLVDVHASFVRVSAGPPGYFRASWLNFVIFRLKFLASCTFFQRNINFIVLGRF